jgi:hypothetical protein
MPIPLSGNKDLWAYLKREWEYAISGRDTGAPNYPAVKSNEAVLSGNAAGNGTVPLVKADAADNVCVTDKTGASRILVNGVPKNITDASPTNLFQVACPASSMVGGTILYLVQASDGTNYQALSGIVTYAAVNKAGTITTAVTEATGNQAKALSTGTLTLTWSFSAGTNLATVSVQGAGSLTETIYNITYTVIPANGAITIL